MLLLPARALAALVEEPTPVQRLKSPTVPAAPTDATDAAEPTVAPEDTLDSTPEPTTVDPVDDPIQVSPPALEPSVSEADRAALDAAWEGVEGFVVDLELEGNESMAGIVGAVQRDTFTLIQEQTGAVLVLPKSGVVSLRVRMPPPLPTESGSGALIGGSILTVAGAPVFASGLAFLIICPDCVGLHLPMLFAGGGALGGGIALLVRGTRRRQAYREAVQERGLAPMALRTRYGWTAGVRFRF